MPKPTEQESYLIETTLQFMYDYMDMNSKDHGVEFLDYDYEEQELIIVFKKRQPPIILPLPRFFMGGKKK